LCQFLLPLLQGGGVGVVHFHRAEGAAGAALTQPRLQASGKAAEVRVLAIAEGQQGIVQVFSAQGWPSTLRSKARALSGASPSPKVLTTNSARAWRRSFRPTRQRRALHRQAGRLQLPGALPGQLLGKAALAGETDQPAVARRCWRRCHGRAHLALLRRRSRYSSQPVTKNSGMVRLAMVTMMRPGKPK
jgi:hypothetical protein